MKRNERLFSNIDLLRLFLPLIIEQFLELFVGLINSMMAAHVGEAAVSAVSLVEFVMALLISLFVALATGGSVVIGQYMGMKKKITARRTANQLVWFLGIVSVIITILIFLIRPLILNGIFGQITDEVRELANSYLLIMLLSIPFVALYNAGAAIFRTMGNSKLPMMIMMVMNLINVIGIGILLFVFKMGIIGIAIPTLFTRAAAGIIIISLAMNKKYEIHIENKLKFKHNIIIIKKILDIGLPSGLENVLFYLGRIIVLSLVALYGTAAIAANAVSGTIVMFEVLPGIAIGLGLTTIISRCIGAKDYEQAKYYNKKIIIIEYIAHFLSCSFVVLILPYLLKIYGLSTEATNLTIKIVWWYTLFQITIWPLAYALPVTFRASGDSKFPMIVGIISMFLCRILLSYIFSKYTNMGMFGTWVAMFADWIVKAIIFVHRYFSGKWIKYLNK